MNRYLKIPLPQAIWNEVWLVAVNGVNSNKNVEEKL